MGFDFYLRYDAISDIEKNQQYTGFIPNGSAGYLRCSINMGKELSILTHLFGVEILVSGKHYGIDFRALEKRVPDLLSAYVEGENIVVNDVVKRAIERNKQKAIDLQKSIEKQDGWNVLMMDEWGDDENRRSHYATHVVEFVKKAVALQKEGQRPYIITRE